MTLDSSLMGKLYTLHSQTVPARLSGSMVFSLCLNRLADLEREHLHLRHTVPDGLCQGGASVSGLSFDFEKTMFLGAGSA